MCPCRTGSSSPTCRCVTTHGVRSESIIKRLLTINEIFYSIQGESTYAGRPCVFVRLTACDLRCSWCDTPYAFHEGRKRSLDDVLAEVDRFDCPLVEVTGGEPLLQDDVYPLMQALLERGKTVLLETGGHRSTARVPAVGRHDPRREVPGQRRGAPQRLEQPRSAAPARRGEVRHQGSRRLRVRARRHRRARASPGASAAIHLSPVHGVLDPRTLSEWVLADRLPVARPAAAPQVHLGSRRHARCLTQSTGRHAQIAMQSSCSAAGSIPTPPRRSRGPRASACSR